MAAESTASLMMLAADTSAMRRCAWSALRKAAASWLMASARVVRRTAVRVSPVKPASSATAMNSSACSDGGPELQDEYAAEKLTAARKVARDFPRKELRESEIEERCEERREIRSEVQEAKARYAKEAGQIIQPDQPEHEADPAAEHECRGIESDFLCLGCHARFSVSLSASGPRPC